jgi:murein DD-endopeptidase MepM/ murein hydrolase activator NlpD
MSLGLLLLAVAALTGPVPPAVVPAGSVAAPPAAPAVAFRWPLAPAPPVIRRFAVGPRPWSPGHRGVDLAAAPRQAVLSAGAGVVTFAGVVAGRGVVAVGHPGGLRTTYEPITASVRTGDRVAAGAVLGALAAGEHCPRSCLHWGALRGRAYLDPLTLLRPPAPPVLLPLTGLGLG